MDKQLLQVGHRAGRWEVIEAQEWPWTQKVQCKCDCGTKRKVDCYALTHGKTSSCGCRTRELAREAGAKRIKHPINVGERYGHLVVLDTTDRRKIKCQCDCGNTSAPSANSLYKGSAKSCGCMRPAKSSAVMKKHHADMGRSGLSQHTLYSTWKRICDEAESGTDVFTPWTKDVRRFVTDVETTIGARPPSRLLVRIDPDGGWVPGNIMWGNRGVVNSRRDIPRVMSAEQKAEAADMVEAGFTQREVAGVYGVYPSYIFHVMKQRRAGTL